MLISLDKTSGRRKPRRFFVSIKKYIKMKLPKDIIGMAFIFLILFVLIKGFKFGEFFANVF